MDRSFCEKIDQDLLVDLYISGQLSGGLKEKFEKHITECEKHAKEVQLEKAFKEGVSAFARSEVKAKIRQKIKKRDDHRLLILRYAAIIFLIVFTPLLLYYQIEFRDKNREQKMDSMLNNESSKLYEVEIVEEIEENEDKKIEQPISAEGVGFIDKNELEPKKSAPSKEPEEVESSKTSDPDQIIKPSPAAPSLKGGEVKSRAITVVDDAVVEDEEIKLEKTTRDKSQDLMGASKEKAIQPIMPLSTTSISQADDIKYVKIKYQSTNEAVEEVTFNNISTQISKYDRQINECFENITDDDRKQYTELMVEFVILQDGKTREVKLINSQFSQGDISRCILDKIRDWQFTDVEKELHVVKTIQM